MATPSLLTDSAPSRPRRRVLLKWSLAISGILLAVLVWRCTSGLIQAKRLIEPAVAHFHAQLNASAYEEIYSDADDSFRAAGAKEDLIKFLTALHKKLGEAGESKSGNINVTATPTGTLITIEYATKFSSGAATETFVWVRDGNTVKLRAYNVNSPALLTN